jgi:hypothetical protein
MNDGPEPYSREAAGDQGIPMIWNGIALEISYRTGIDPDEVAKRVSLAMQEKYPDRDYDDLIAPLIATIMRAAGMKDEGDEPEPAAGGARGYTDDEVATIALQRAAAETDPRWTGGH